jgi:hypothetical protein
VRPAILCQRCFTRAHNYFDARHILFLVEIYVQRTTPPQPYNKTRRRAGILNKSLQCESPMRWISNIRSNHCCNLSVKFPAGLHLAPTCERSMCLRNPSTNLSRQSKQARPGVRTCARSSSTMISSSPKGVYPALRKMSVSFLVELTAHLN